MALFPVDLFSTVHIMVFEIQTFNIKIFLSLLFENFLNLTNVYHF